MEVAERRAAVLRPRAATVLADRPGVRLPVPGGEVWPGEQMFVGEVARGIIAGLDIA